MPFYTLNIILVLCSVHIFEIGAEYTPDWKSLESRPLPHWYDEAKIGIFIHWGVYSVPSFASEWFWKNWKDNRSDIVNFMEKNYKPGFSYQDFAHQFTAEFFDPVKWAKLFEASGAKYVILTSKHHDGYALWPSAFSYSWNSQDIGPHRNIVDELSSAIRTHTKLHFGLYHSLYEWFHPLYLSDKESNFTSQRFVDAKIIPEMKELIHSYKPELLWSDGEWEARDTYWRSKEFLAWLYNESPVKDVIVTNDRWGSNTLCKHGGFLTCVDRYNPGILQKRKWENALTIDSHSWGFRRNADIKDFLTTKDMIGYLAQAISCNGNIVFNVGPTKEGSISPIYQERLYNLGDWLRVNKDGVYGSRPWGSCQNDTITSGVWYTTKKLKNEVVLYAIVLDWPSSGNVTLGCLKPLSDMKITMLGVDSPLKWSNSSGSEVVVAFPDREKVAIDWAWTLMIRSKKNYFQEFQIFQVSSL